MLLILWSNVGCMIGQLFCSSSQPPCMHWSYSDPGMSPWGVASLLSACTVLPGDWIHSDSWDSPFHSDRETHHSTWRHSTVTLQMHSVSSGPLSHLLKVAKQDHWDLVCGYFKCHIMTCISPGVAVEWWVTVGPWVAVEWWISLWNGVWDHKSPCGVTSLTVHLSHGTTSLTGTVWLLPVVTVRPRISQVSESPCGTTSLPLKPRVSAFLPWCGTMNLGTVGPHVSLPCCRS